MMPSVCGTVTSSFSCLWSMGKERRDDFIRLDVYFQLPVKLNLITWYLSFFMQYELQYLSGWRTSGRAVHNLMAVTEDRFLRSQKTLSSPPLSASMLLLRSCIIKSNQVIFFFFSIQARITIPNLPQRALRSVQHVTPSVLRLLI